MPKITFTKKTLDAMLERILDEFFADDNEACLGEVIDYVKVLYADEIDALEVVK